MTIAIRPARPDEAAAVTEVVEAAYTPWVAQVGIRPWPLDDEYEPHVAAGRVWVTEDDDGLTGILVLVDEPDCLMLDNVAVLPRLHGKGVGRALMAFAEQEARRRGYTAIRLYTLEKMLKNIAIYAAMGYRETHRAREKGRDRVYMRKELATG